MFGFFFHFRAHSRGLKIIIGSSVIFAAVITLALILFIYLGKPQVKMLVYEYTKNTRK